ncbi:MAG: trypsin-like peptidase domain-containing protein [Chloroflexi bacterium]|nr:trypsin-like peptidase domain-containing protein [Chloroflexota bacterium]
MFLSSTRLRRLASGALPLMLLAAVACGGAAATAVAPTQQDRPEPAAPTTLAAASVQEIINAPDATAGQAAQVQNADALSSLTLETSSASEAPAAPPETDEAVAAVVIDADMVVAAFEEVLGRIHEKALPSVVRITVAQTVSADEFGQDFNFPFGVPAPDPDTDSPRDFFFRNGEGSGFVWSAEGHIVTNQHVVADADRVTVIFPDGLELIAEVLGTDTDSDLAVLKVEVPAGGLVPIELGDSSDVKVGQLAVAIGNPFGQEFTTTTGIVSAVGRTIRGGNTQFSIPQVIQTDAPINPGNSGGPLLDRHGRVIGINTQIISRTGASVGIGFAVPINAAKQVIPELIENGEFEYAWLGISGNTVRREILQLMDVPSETRGALVIDLAPSGPAEAAGLAGASRTEETAIGLAPVGGDIIVGIDGSPIKSMDDLITYLIENTRPGDRIAVDVIRDGGEEATIEVVLGTRPGEVN